MDRPWVLKLLHSNLQDVAPYLREIKLNRETTFGRYGTTTDDNIMVPSKYMSRRKPHCKFIPSDDSLHLVSLGGVNPTFKNNDALAENIKFELQPGDHVGLGICRPANVDAYVYVVTRPTDSDDDDIIVVSDSEEEDSKSILKHNLSLLVVSKPIISRSTVSPAHPSTSESVPLSAVTSECILDEQKPVKPDLSVPSNDLVGNSSLGSEKVLNHVQLGSASMSSDLNLMDEDVNESKAVASTVEKKEESKKLEQKVRKNQPEKKAEVKAENICSDNIIGTQKNMPASSLNEKMTVVTEASTSANCLKSVASKLGTKAVSTDKTLKPSTYHIEDADRDVEDLHSKQSHSQQKSSKDKKLKLVQDKNFKVSKHKKVKSFSRIIKYEEYEKKSKSKLDEGEGPAYSGFNGKKKIKKCFVILERLTPEAIKKAMYPKKALKKSEILVLSRGKRNRDEDERDDNEEKARTKRQKEKSDDMECDSKTKKKIKRDEPLVPSIQKQKNDTTSIKMKPDFDIASGSDGVGSYKKVPSDDIPAKKTKKVHLSDKSERKSENEKPTSSKIKQKVLEIIEDDKIHKNADPGEREKRKNSEDVVLNKKIRTELKPENSNMDDNQNPLANYETVIIKQEPIDKVEEWDYSQYTLDDDDIIFLDEYPPTSASLTLHESQTPEESIFNESTKLAEDMPFDNEFNWFANSQNDLVERDLPQDLEDINDSSSWDSDNEIFESKTPKDMSTPKCRKVNEVHKGDKKANKNQKDVDFARDIFGSSDNEENLEDKTDSAIKMKSVSPADDLEDVSDNQSPDIEDNLIFSDIDSPPQPSDEQSMSDVSSESSSDLFEEISSSLAKEKNISEKGKLPKLIEPLPLLPRRRGKKSSKIDSMEQKTKKTIEKKPEFIVKPKAFFTEKIHLIKGTKDKTKGSRWYIDVKRNKDKQSAQALKEERRKKLKELGKRRLSDEPEPSTSAQNDDNQHTDYHRSELSKPAVKLTKVNRGAFLTEDMPQGKKSNQSKILNSSPQKIVISNSSTIIVEPTKSARESFSKASTSEFVNNMYSSEEPYISAKEKIVQNLGSLPEKIPLALKELGKCLSSDELEPSTSAQNDNHYHQSEPAVKLTKGNRVAFLKEDMSQGKKTDQSKTANSSPQKIAISKASIVIVEPTESVNDNLSRASTYESVNQAYPSDETRVSGNEKGVQKLESLPDKIPLVLPSIDSASKREKKKEVLPGVSQLFVPDELVVSDMKKKSQVHGNLLLKNASAESVKLQSKPGKLPKSDLVDAAKNKISNATSTKKAKGKSLDANTSKNKETVPESNTSGMKVKVIDSSTSNSRKSVPIPSEFRLRDQVSKSLVTAPVEATTMISSGSSMNPVSSHKGIVKLSFSTSISSKAEIPVKTRPKGSILRVKSKYDNENKENRTGPRLRFNDSIEIKLYKRDNCDEGMKETSSTSGMTRHPLPEFRNSSMIECETSRLICSMLNWLPKWEQKEKNLGFPPPIWKREYILYLQSERQTLGLKSLVPMPDEVERSMNLPPRACGIKFPSYEQYRKEWYRLMLLELWAMVLPSKDMVFSGEIVQYTNANNMKQHLIIDLSIPLLEDMAALLLPNAGDFVLLEFFLKDRQNNGQIQMQRLFGYVEKDAIVETAGRLKKMHPETFKPVVATCELKIMTKYTELDLQHLKIIITKCTYAKYGTKLMRALFELSLSPLKDIILCPNLKTLAEPIPEPSQRLSPQHMTNLIKFMVPIPISDEQLDVIYKITQTIRTDKPSLNIIDGFSGTGKTRTLVAIVVSLLVDYILTGSKQNKHRILVCLPTYESLNSFVLLLNSVRQYISQLKKKSFNYVVIGKESNLRGPSQDFSLQTIISRRTHHARERERQGEELEEMMESDENILEATVNSTKLTLEYLRTKDKSAAQDLESKLHSMEEKLRRMKLGIRNETTNNIRYKNRLDHLIKDTLQNQSDVIITTLSGLANTTYFSQTFGVNMYAQTPICLIDDAHQAHEIQCLLPLIFGAHKLVLAGDLLLPGATLKSEHASKLGLSNSLLLRVNRSVKSDILKSPTKSGSEDTSEQLKGLTYHKLKIQRRLPRILSEVATQCLNAPKLIPGAKVPWDRTTYKPRELVIFDHDLPVMGSLRSPMDRREVWLQGECHLAIKLLVLIKHKLALYPQNYNIMVLVPEETDKERMKAIVSEVKFMNPNGNYFISTLDSCGGLSANIVIACLGDETSRLQKVEYVTLALTRVKSTFIILGHLDYFKREKHWLEIIKKAEKYRARLSVTSFTYDQQLVDFIFKNENSSGGSPSRTADVPRRMEVEHEDGGSQLVIDTNFNKYNRFL